MSWSGKSGEVLGHLSFYIVFLPTLEILSICPGTKSEGKSKILVFYQNKRGWEFFNVNICLGEGFPSLQRDCLSLLRL